MEKVLTVSFVAPEAGDYACLSVSETTNGHIKVLNMFYGAEAELMYRKLAEPALPFKTNMVNTALMERDNWLMDRLVANFRRPWEDPFPQREDPPVKPFLLSVEQLEEILKEPVKCGPGTLLHNKECPHGHQCQATDCIECMQIYEKVDTSGPDETAIVNTAAGGSLKLEEYI